MNLFIVFVLSSVLFSSFVFSYRHHGQKRRLQDANPDFTKAKEKLYKMLDLINVRFDLSDKYRSQFFKILANIPKYNFITFFLL